MGRTQFRLVALLAALALGVVSAFTITSAALATHGDNHQVWVCKYDGKPGHFETLKSGKQPIIVDVAAAYSWSAVSNRVWPEWRCDGWLYAVPVIGWLYRKTAIYGRHYTFELPKLEYPPEK